MKTLFIGAGNMAQAIISGIIKKGIMKNEEISVYEINRETCEKVSADYKINIINKLDGEISGFDLVFLAVKPQSFSGFITDDEMKKLPALIKKEAVVVSIMAGITIEKLGAFFGNETVIIRVMPNTPALVLQAMSAISGSKNANEKQLNAVKTIFEAVGKAEIMDEKMLDAVTALSGSGPAYVFTFIEALTQAGVLCGLSKQVSENLAVQTIIGSCLMIGPDNPVESLRHRVTSPAGTTIEGIAVLEKQGFRSAVIEAVRAAFNRSKELSGKKTPDCK